ncbi:hypothetical protein EOL94_00435 [bacterium]|nr:hypothetical protein [bacterium]
MKKKQLVLIHGGETFKNRKDYLDYLKNKTISLESKVSWTGDYLEDKLGRYFDIIKPRMPLKDNAKYSDWKIVFERYLEVLDDEIVLIGNSLGGIFLAKYLSEDNVSKNILSLCFVAPPFSSELLNEDLCNGFVLKDDLSKIEKQCENINFFFSLDDKIVPIKNMRAYKKKIKNANYFPLDNVVNHFFTDKLPEIVGAIKKDLNLK